MLLHQVLSEFVNLFVEKHFHLNNVNFFIHIGKALWLSWLKPLSSKQEIVSLNLISPIFNEHLAAKKGCDKIQTHYFGALAN